MKKYESYKDTGNDWVGEIPSHWEMKKLSYNTYMKGRIGWQGLKQEEFTDEGPYLITGMNFKNGVIRWDEVYHITEERYNEAPEIKLNEGDVLMTKDGTIGKLLFVDKLPGPASLNSHLLVLRPLDKTYIPKYLYYQLQSSPFLAHIELTKTGTTFFGITQQAVSQYKMLLPPIVEQIAIVNYLDNRSAKIDQLIQQKETLLEKLQQKRQAIINESVTKGINASVEMKDSGIEWMGRIPKHWEVKKLKYIIELKSGDSIKAEDFVDEGEYNVYGGNGFMGKTFSFNSDALDIIIGRVGAKCGNVRLVGGKKWISDNALIASSNIDYEYTALLLEAMDLNSMANKSAQPLLTGTMIKNRAVAVPPLSEQKKILEQVKRVSKKIDKTAELITSQIENLYAYRQSLITEVVTGKRKVV